MSYGLNSQHPPSIAPIMLPYISPYITLFKEFRLIWMFSTRTLLKNRFHVFGEETQMQFQGFRVCGGFLCVFPESTVAVPGDRNQKLAPSRLLFLSV